MSLTERSELLAALHRQKAEVGVIFQRAQDAGALSVCMKVETARIALDEAIEEFRPDSPAPFETHYLRTKH